MGSFEIIDRLCEVSDLLLEIVRKQQEVIEQADIAEEVKKELAEMRDKADKDLDLIEMRLRKCR